MNLSDKISSFVFWGGRHSSVVSSVPTILRPWVQILSTQTMLFQEELLTLLSECEEDENERKRSWDWDHIF